MLLDRTRQRCARRLVRRRVQARLLLLVDEHVGPLVEDDADARLPHRSLPVVAEVPDIVPAPHVAKLVPRARGSVVDDHAPEFVHRFAGQRQERLIAHVLPTRF